VYLPSSFDEEGYGLDTKIAKYSNPISFVAFFVSQN
jgi:hypothetical protein